MPNLALRFADEIASFLNGKFVDMEQLRSYRKIIWENSLAESKDLTAVVVPHGVECKISDRSREFEWTVQIDVGICRRATEHEMEHLLSLVQEIGEMFEGKIFHNVLNGVCIGVDYAPLYASDFWIQSHCFLSVMVLTIKVFK